MEEARRRLSMAEDECAIMPDMSDPSTLLNEEHIKKVSGGLKWEVVFHEGWD